MKYRRLLVIPLCALYVASVCADGSALGRLFTTPQQRAALDQMRHSGELRDAQPLASESMTAPANEKITFNGMYIAPDGERHYWINGSEKKPQSINVIRLDSSGVVTVKHAMRDSLVQMRAGQSLQPDTGKIARYYEKPELEETLVAPAKQDSTQDPDPLSSATSRAGDPS